MADDGDLNLADLLMTECLWTSFAKVLQIGLDEVKNNWNTHYIRKSRFETVSGRPDSLYTIPEFHGRIDGLIVPVQSVALDYAYFHDHLVEVSNNQMDYHEYFQYVMNELRLAPPNDWKDAFERNEC